MVSMENIVFLCEASKAWELFFSNQNYGLAKFVVNFFATFTNSIIIGQRFNLFKKFIGCFLEEKNIDLMFIYECNDLICFFFLFQETFGKKLTLLLFILFSTNVHILNVFEAVNSSQQCFVTDKVKSATIYNVVFQLLQFFLF